MDIHQIMNVVQLHLPLATLEYISDKAQRFSPSRAAVPRQLSNAVNTTGATAPLMSVAVDVHLTDIARHVMRSAVR